MTDPNEPARPLEPDSATVLTPGVRNLPPLPSSVYALLALNLKDPGLAEQLQAIIEADPALAVHVLTVANSAAYRGFEDVTTLNAAIERVGAPMIIGNVLQGVTNKVFDPYGGMGRRLAQIALLEAHLMKALAGTFGSRLGVAPDVAYVHGLLHDIGHFILAMTMGRPLEAFQHRRIPPDELSQREVTMFGFDHQSAGRVLTSDKLPPSITLVIGTHHHPREMRTGHSAAANATIDLLRITDRVSRLITQHAEDRAAAERAILEWAATPEGRNILEPIRGGAADVRDAVALALRSLDQSGRVWVGGGPSS